MQASSNIPLLIAVDEEGGKVVRVSSNSNLSKERFKSSSELYALGGFDKIREDTINKSKLLANLGINLNLAPVVDISTNPTDYMYERTLKQPRDIVSEYASCVISASKGFSVSYALKHFPGYGNNIDTHKGSSIDNRSYEDIMNNDIKPFISGINAGAEAVLISHNIVNSIDSESPASLSPKIHELLRNDLGFSGVIITDDLYMDAISNDETAVEKAINAGNDLIIVTEYEKSVEAVKNALASGKVSEAQIDTAVKRVLAWKLWKGMM